MGGNGYTHDQYWLAVIAFGRKTKRSNEGYTIHLSTKCCNSVYTEACSALSAPCTINETIVRLL